MANSFYPFAINADSHIMNLTTWATSPDRTAGNIAGTPANSALNNRAIHQGTMMAAALGIYIDSKGWQAVDDGDANNLAANLASALGSQIDDSAAAAIQKAVDENVAAPGNLTHNALLSRTVSDCHPISAITNLQTTLDNLAAQIASGNVPDATTTTRGIIRLATQEEVNAGSSYTSAVAPYTLKNTQFSSSQIPNLSASKVTTGVFDAARIPTLSAAKITSGVFAVARIPDLDASKITSGTFDPARIPALEAVNIPDLPASKITSGTFTTDRIPELPASRINSGVFGAALIPNLDASKITSGTLDVARLPSIAVSFANIGGVYSDNTSLYNALSAMESSSNKVTTITSSSTDTQYPSAKAVYALAGSITPSASVWGNITGNISDQQDLYSLISNKVTCNDPITAGTKCKISYDTKGLVTGGRDLEVSDIPDLPASKITGQISEDQLPEVDQSTLVSGSTTTHVLLKVPTTEGFNMGLGFDSSTYSFTSLTWQNSIPNTDGGTGYMLLNLPSGVSSYVSAAGTGVFRVKSGTVNRLLYVTSVVKQSNTQLRVNLFCPAGYATGNVYVYAGLEYSLRTLVTY